MLRQDSLQVIDDAQVICLTRLDRIFVKAQIVRLHEEACSLIHCLKLGFLGSKWICKVHVPFWHYFATDIKVRIEWATCPSLVNTRVSILLPLLLSLLDDCSWWDCTRVNCSCCTAHGSLELTAEINILWRSVECGRLHQREAIQLSIMLNRVVGSLSPPFRDQVSLYQQLFVLIRRYNHAWHLSIAIEKLILWNIVTLEIRLERVDWLNRTQICFRLANGIDSPIVVIATSNLRIKRLD